MLYDFRRPNLYLLFHLHHTTMTQETEFQPIDFSNNKSYQDTLELLSMIESHAIRYNQISELRGMSFKTGRTLYLEVDVKDPALSTLLHRWLYGTNENPELLLFGCRLQAIHYSAPGLNELKAKLQKYIDSL